MLRPTLASVALGALLAGCGSAQDAGDDLSADQPIGETSSALCTDSGAANYSAALGNSEGDGVWRTSPSRTYGSAACQSMYVVEVTNTLGKTFTMNATWGEALPSTEQSCPMALLVADAYGYVNGQWVSIGHKSAGGQWTGSGFGQGCSIGVNWAVSHSLYSKVRIATKAAAFLLFTSDPRKVAASVVTPPRPPA